MERLHAQVYGRVQGVSFRYYTTRKAEALGLRGWVRNRRDGSVETTAEGERDELEAFLEFLHHGPSGAHVSRVESAWQDASGEFKTFEIRF